MPKRIQQLTSNTTPSATTVFGTETDNVLTEDSKKMSIATIDTYLSATTKTLSNKSFSTSAVFTVASAGVTLKRGSNGKCGTFTANGATPVTVSNTSVAITDTIIFSLNTVGGTVGAYPAIQTITASTGFTVACTASDTSVYNYCIISNLA